MATYIKVRPGFIVFTLNRVSCSQNFHTIVLLSQLLQKPLTAEQHPIQSIIFDSLKIDHMETEGSPLSSCPSSTGFQQSLVRMTPMPSNTRFSFLRLSGLMSSIFFSECQCLSVSIERRVLLLRKRRGRVSFRNRRERIYLIQHHSQIYIWQMNQGEQQIIKVQVYHELIGNHNFQFSSKTHTSDLRLHILENSPLYIYENFHLEYQGARLQDCNEISEIFKGDVRLLVVFDPYDEYSSRYHELKVKKIIANPSQWLALNREFSSKVPEETSENLPALKLDELFDDPFSSILLPFNQKKESDFSNIIHSSGFNPPSFSRKLLGDLYYLLIKTPQEIDYHVTANPYGFFVNQSTQGSFNPHPHAKYSSSISLIDLLFQISPKFKIGFQEAQKAIKQSQFQRWGQLEAGLIVNTVWMVENKCWKKGNSWKNDSYQYNYKTDYTVIKDWVEIFQYQLSSSSDSLYEKIGKEKLRYRIYQEFVESVRDCVFKIFNGTIKPINNSPRLQHQIYYYSSLLFYFTNDGLKEDNKLPSGYSANKEILTLSLLEQLETDKVSLSHSAVVNYRGYKIVAKAVPSSLIDADVQYYSIRDILAGSNQAQSDEAVLAAARKICKYLGYESQNLIVDKDGNPRIVCVGPELTACSSKDSKKFILETKIFSCRDFNFNSSEPLECFLRPQLMKIFNAHQKCSILYNPNIGTPVNLSNIEKHKQQHKKLQSVAKFAKEIMVPSVIDSFDGDIRKYLSDSTSIIQALHRYGLSAKYLGLVCTKASEKKAQHVKIMVQRAILVRSSKTLFKKALRETPSFLHKTVIKNLFNCLFEDDTENNSSALFKQLKTDDETEWSGTNKKAKKKKSKENETCFEMNFGKPSEKFCTMKKQQFWEEIKLIALIKFKHVLSKKSSFFEFEFSKVAILRDLCLCLGIILEKKDYFCADGSATFIEDNIVNIVPRVKVVKSQPKELNELIEEGDRLTNKFQIEEAFEVYNKAFQYVFSSFGEMHQKLGLMYKKFAGLHYKIGDLDAAVLFALNSHEIYQNLGGNEHIQAIEALMMVGVYQFGRKKFAAAEFYILKAIFLAKFAYSECYPEVLVMHMNLSTVYEAQRKYTDAIMSLFMALNISIRVYGQSHLHTAIVFSALASLHYDIPDIEQTIKFQQRSIAILQELLGSEDERVIEAKNTCEGYRNIQNSKKVREVHQKDQRNAFGLPSLNKFGPKPPYYDSRERGTDFFWKKPKKLKYFF